MIPLKLTIEGLYSYRSRQVIDFETLTRSGLFGIFGGVGSGKSSILEAISFALYGECERLNSRDNRNYNMMNLKSNELLIDFEFRSHGDEVYRFMVRGKRSKSKFDDVKAYERSAYRLQEDQWIPVPTDHVEKITGLNHRNFHRTIIIPQGKFQEFLQLSSGERSSMLRELFNLGRFELSDKVARLESRNEAKINNLKGRLSEIGIPDPALMDELKQQRTTLSDQMAILRQKLAENEKTELEARELQSLSGKILLAEKHLEELKHQEEAIAAEENIINRYERFAAIFQHDLILLKEMYKKTGETSGKLSMADQELGRLNQLAESIHKQLGAHSETYERREELQQKSKELVKLAELKTAIRNLEELKIRSAETSAIVIENSTAIEKKRMQLAEEEMSLEVLRKDLPDMVLISAVREWLAGYNRLLGNQQETNKKILEVSARLTEMNHELTGVLRRSPFSLNITDPPDGVQIREEIIQSLAETQKESARLQQKLTELQVQKKLEDYATELHDGQPCPLCGSVEHPAIPDPSGVEEKLAAAIAQAEKLKEREDNFQKMEKYLGLWQVRTDALLRQRLDLEKESKELTTSIAGFLESFSWPGFDPESSEKVRTEEERYKKTTAAIRDKEGLIKSLSGQIREDERHTEAKRQEMSNMAAAIAAAETKAGMIRNDIRTSIIDSYLPCSADELLHQSLDLQHQYEEVIRKHDDLNRQNAELEVKISGHRGQILMMETRLSEINTEILELSTAIDEKRATHGGLSREEIDAVLQQPVDVEKGRLAIEAYRRECALQVRLLDELIGQCAGRHYDEAAHSKLIEEVATMKTALESNSTRLVSLEIEIAREQQRSADYQQVNALLQEAESRHREIAELKSLFRNSGFVNYISTVYLRNLCDAANDRYYRLTRQQQGLELSSDNSFMIRDYMNEGRLRSVKTLSGGQTFQASLALALALADSINRLAGSSGNFFFLDEGFGTLDKETLAIAFDALKSLRRENRIVGVISHVEEMQAEIETCLKITNDEEHGSIIRPGWK